MFAASFFVNFIPDVQAEKRIWATLSQDGIHDPESPALELLQDPSEALSVLPSAKSGNQVDWMAALRSGAIRPRTNVNPETEVEISNIDILFEQTASMPMVLFPHQQHTEWLACSNCHDRIFKRERGANEFGMFSVLEGEFCGQCHGAVSFPLTDCNRCHSVSRAKVMGAQ